MYSDSLRMYSDSLRMYSDSLTMYSMYSDSLTIPVITAHLALNNNHSLKHNIVVILLQPHPVCVSVMMFNTTFNNISVISWPDTSKFLCEKKTEKNNPIYHVYL
jgi:hypothetical protein